MMRLTTHSATTQPATGIGQPEPGVIDQFRAGDHAAFGALVRNYQSYAYALAVRLVWEQEEAEDLVQDAFVRVWEHRESFDPGARFTTWLYTIVTRLSIDRIRSRGRWQRIIQPARWMDPEPEPVLQWKPEIAMDDRQLLTTVRRLVQHLPHTQRIVFTLRDLQDLPVEEVAEITGLSAQAIKASLCYARKRIRKSLTNMRVVEGR